MVARPPPGRPALSSARHDRIRPPARRPARARLPALARLLALTLGPAGRRRRGRRHRRRRRAPRHRPRPRPRPRPPVLPAPVSAALAQAAELPRLERTFIERHLPAPLLEPGPRGLRWWQWIALPVAAALALLLGSLLGWATRRFLAHLATRTETSWDDLLIERLARPITLFWALVVASAALPALGLDAAFDEVISRGIKAGLFLVAFWGAFRAIDVAFGALADGAGRQRQRRALRGTLPLLRKIAKVSALALGLVAVLNELGFHVTSLLAGLGIGGLAVALAAQKTVENLIGSVAIGVDQPFRVGDFVQVDGALGTVERVGLRSTRHPHPRPHAGDAPQRQAGRHAHRVLLGARPLPPQHGAWRWSSPPARRRSAPSWRRWRPSSWPTRPAARRRRRCASSSSATRPSRSRSWPGSRRPATTSSPGLRAELYLRFLEIVREAGTTFAYPTQTLHVASLPAGRPEGRCDRQKR